MSISDHSTSEIIGALVLSLVLISLFAVISTILLSQPYPEHIPTAEFSLVIDESEVIVSLRRGDSFLVSGEKGLPATYLKVDGTVWPVTTAGKYEPGTFELVNQSSKSDSNYLSVGDQLIGTYNGSRPQMVQFVYRSPQGGEYLLWGRGDEEQGVITVSPTATTTIQTVSPTSTSTPTETATTIPPTSTPSPTPTPFQECNQCGPGEEFLVAFTTKDIDTHSIRLKDDTTPQPNTRFWTLGDGNSESGEIIDHTYLSAGSYLITLTVKKNNNPCTCTLRKWITVF